MGTESRSLIDTSRTDAQAPDPNTPRALLVQLFYPTDAAAPGSTVPYLSPEVGSALARILAGPTLENVKTVPPRLPTRWESLVRSPVRDRPPLSSDGALFPVVFFSHGYGVPAGIYTSLLSDLASYGYFVVAINHTYDTSLVEFPGGERAPYRPVKNINDEGDAHIGVWVADVRYVLDQLTQWAHAEAGLVGRLDLEHVGVFGHSYGGAMAAEVSALDPRFKAAAVLDSRLYSPKRSSGGRAIPVPVLLQTTEQKWKRAIWGDVVGVFSKAESASYHVTIAGLLHLGFTELGQIMAHVEPGQGVDASGGPGITGPIDPEKSAAILAAYNRAFFDKHLKSKAAPLLESTGSSPYPEVTFETPGQDAGSGCNSTASPATMVAVVLTMARLARRRRS